MKNKLLANISWESFVAALCGALLGYFILQFLSNAHIAFNVFFGMIGMAICLLIIDRLVK